jgi:hypothetical protein
VGLIVAASAITAVITGIAIADAGSPPSAGYIPLTPVHKILSSASIGANATTSPIAIGGSTTVPSNATAVQMTVTVNDTRAGSLHIFPAGDPTAGGATAVSFLANTATTETVTETVGKSSEISFQNTAASTATVTVTLIGYSTQITASNISPDGGTAGQVLTNSGTGVSWQRPAGVIGTPQVTQFTGPLPHSFTFTKEQADSILLISYSGTGFSVFANTTGFLTPYIDDHYLGDASASHLTFNNTGEHLAFPALQLVEAGISAGTHTFKLWQNGTVSTDVNDYYYVTIIETMPG